MADYYPLLARAVAGLPENSAQARATIYERARSALVGQLRRLEPPIPQEEIDRESAALEAAVARLEAEAAPEPVEAASESPASPERPAPEPAPVEAPIESSESSPIVEASVAEPEAFAAAPSEDVAGDPEEARKEDVAEAPPAAERAWPEPRRRPGTGAPGGLQTRPPMFFKSRRDRAPLEPGPARPSLGPPLAPPPVDAPLSPEPSASEAAPAEWRADPEAPVADAFFPGAGEPAHVAAAMARKAEGEAAGEGGEPTPVAEAASARAKSEAQRPFAPQPRRDEPSPRRFWILGFVVGLAVLLVAVAAYRLRDRPEELRQKAEAQSSVAAPEPAAPAGKIVERVGAGASGEAVTPRPADQEQPRPQPAAPPPTQSARRAALLLEAPDEPGKVKTLLGAVVWKVDNVSAGPADPLSTAVRATVEIPEEKLEVVITFQKNSDASLPASHTMKIQFIEGEGDPLGPVQQISAPQMRREDTATGDALSGVPVKVTDNTFLVGLSGGDAEAANLDLIRNRGWIDVPMLLANGKIAKLTFEKGEAGERAIADAIETWKAQ
ncbi:hypothetical protein [Methylocella sp.]|uniref:hypothetical protein n=1 Tax=Methylocella sp. TaxID=1978226 RepID=UPI0035ADA71B